MRLLKRNLKTIYYCLYGDKISLVDENGHRTGETVVSYLNYVPIECSVSPSAGYSQAETFGSLESYDKVIVTDDMTCPINENTVLFIDKLPEYKNGQPVYDYIVRRVAKSLNSISYAVSKVDVS